MRYYLIGVYPPPLGGVSVFLYRYSRILREEGHQVTVLDVSKLGRFARLWELAKVVLDPRFATYQPNAIDFYVIAALLLRPFPKRIIFHTHSNRQIGTFGPVRRWLLGRMLRTADERIMVADHIQKRYEAEGYEVPSPVRIQYAYLPPPLEDEPAIWATYDRATLEFLESHRPLVVGNAFRISFHEGVDLYGLDMSVRLIADLARSFPGAGLLFYLADVGDEAYLDRLRQRCADLGVADRVCFVLGQREQWPVFKKADVMIRPTCADGDAISIREAMQFGCPVVASDVVVRPEGTVLFRNRDDPDFAKQVRSALDSRA